MSTEPAQAPSEAVEAADVVVSTEGVVAPTEAMEPVAAAPTVAAAPYVLPLEALADMARAAGLEWINSDADKVRVVQEAIAAEPPPVRVPRVIKPVVLIDEGPLVLVETRRDLAGLTLPFERG